MLSKNYVYSLIFRSSIICAEVGNTQYWKTLFSDIKLSIENDLKLLKSQNHPSVAQLTRADKLNPMVTELLQRL